MSLLSDLPGIEKDELKAMFPKLWKFACIRFALPMSTAGCEQLFSALKRTKTDMHVHNRLSSKILNSLMTTSIEGHDPDQIPYEKYAKFGQAGRTKKFV